MKIQPPQLVGPKPERERARVRETVAWPASSRRRRSNPCQPAWPKSPLGEMLLTLVVVVRTTSAVHRIATLPRSLTRSLSLLVTQLQFRFGGLTHGVGVGKFPEKTERVYLVVLAFSEAMRARSGVTHARHSLLREWERAESRW